MVYQKIVCSYCKSDHVVKNGRQKTENKDCCVKIQNVSIKHFSWNIETMRAVQEQKRKL